MGVAKDLTRHVLQLLKARRYGQARSDIKLMIGGLGAGLTGLLLALGARELARKRRLKRRRGSAEGGAAALAKARRTA